MSEAYSFSSDDLGVYRSEEHIDNPFLIPNYAALDPSNGWSVGNVSHVCDINPKTLFANFIATPSPTWKTSLDVVRNKLLLSSSFYAADKDKSYMHLGAALHVMADLFSHR